MTRRRRAPRPRARGFSLLEILVVLAIIALITGVVAIAVMKHLETARKETTRQSALTLRTAVVTFRMQRSDGECPTTERLVEDGFIDAASKTKDAWDQPFAIACDDRGGVHVASAGPDKQAGTPDDIRVP